MLRSCAFRLCARSSSSLNPWAPLPHFQMQRPVFRSSGKLLRMATAAAAANKEEGELHPLRGSGNTGDDSSGNNGGGGRGGGGGGGGSSGDGGFDAYEGRSGGAGRSVLAWYMKLLEERPVLTKAVTAATLTLIGDVFTQFVIEKSSSLDVKRTAVITSLGFLLVGPTLHYWYLSLSKVVKASGAKGAAMRLALDQLLFSPIFIGVFFVSLLVMEGRPSDIGPKLSQDWPSAVVTNWKIWVPFQFLNFLFVPQQLQVAAANVIALVWNAYLSFATHTDVVDTEKQS